MENAVTPETLRELLEYDPATGVLTWKRRDRKWFNSDRICNSWNARYPGKEYATQRNTGGHRQGRIFYRLFLAHRVAWAIHHGEWPKGEIDHKNRIRDDNRLSNLRDVSKSENQRNKARRKDNTSGVNGVNFSESIGKWVVRVQANGERHYLGCFSDMNEALVARDAAYRKYGFSDTHGEAA